MRLAATFLLAIVALLSMALPVPTTATAAASGILPNGQGGAIGQDTVLKRLYMAQPSTNKVFVVDSSTLLLLGVISVPPRPSAVVVDSKLHLVYITSDEKGVLGVYDGTTYKLLHSVKIGGRPGGLTLIGSDRTLLITDESSGIVNKLRVVPKFGVLERSLSMGPGPDPTDMLSPESASFGYKITTWAQNFAPEEPVQVLWGMQPIGMLKADELGAVIGEFKVPKKTDLGLNLVVLIGQKSQHAQSGLLNVVKPPPPPPPPPKKPVPKPQSESSKRIDRLYASKVSFAPPKMVAIGPLKNRSFAVPTMYLVLVYVVVTMIVLLLRRGRRREAAKDPGLTSGKKAKKGKNRPAPRRAAA